MRESIPDVSYIVVGSEDRLSKIKSYQIEDGTECLLCPFPSLAELPSILDSKIAALDSKVISLIPVGAFPISFGAGIILEANLKALFRV
jgi:hypothetical protein